MEKTQLLGGLSKYCQAMAYSATVLFSHDSCHHRFSATPAGGGDPFIDSFDSPVLQSFHLAFLALYILGVVAQCLWLRKSVGVHAAL